MDVLVVTGLLKDPGQQTQSCQFHMLLKSPEDEKAGKPKPEAVAITSFIFPASHPL